MPDPPGWKGASAVADVGSKVRCVFGGRAGKSSSKNLLITGSRVAAWAQGQLLLIDSWLQLP